MKECVYNLFDLGIVPFAGYMTFSVTLIFLTVNILRPVFGKKFRGSWRYAVWAVLPLCFLFPLKIKTDFSFIPITGLLLCLPLKVNSAPLEFTGIDDRGGFRTENVTPDVLTVGDVFVWIWLAVFIILIIKQLAGLYFLKKRIARRGISCTNRVYAEELEKVCREVNIPVPALTVFPEADTPFAMGIIRPEIILPSQDMTVKEAGFIFRHEAVHIKRHDILIKLMMIIFRCANWFNPLAHLMCRQAFEDMEITCDERAVEGMDSRERAEYSEAILKGISRGKYPAVTTYLSSNAKTLKRRISAVMTLKKAGWIIPFGTALCAALLCSSVVYCENADNISPGYEYVVHIDPFKIEEDPYVTTEEWRSCTAESAEEAGRKIFDRYMQMYMGGEVPEYYRIEDYYITDIIVRDAKGIDALNITKYWGIMGPMGDKVYCTVDYNMEVTNKCGNTVHHMHTIPVTQHFNGLYSRCEISMELERKGNEYTLNSIGTCAASVMGMKHFENSTGYTEKQLDYMGRCGMLDYSWDIYENLPNAEDVNAFQYLTSKETAPDMDVYLQAVSLLDGKINVEHLANASNVDRETGTISIEGYSIKNSRFEYCGADFDCETLDLTVYGNVTGDAPHGVILTFKKEANRSPLIISLISLEVTKELFTPFEYHDSFDNISLPEFYDRAPTEENAEAVLRYMKSPRDGSDFTVLDYRNITEKTDGIYAEVKFKGRLRGVYSSDLQKDSSGNDGFIWVKVL